MQLFGTRDEYDKQTANGMIGEENCPFCDGKTDEKYVIWEWDFWRIMYNRYPYIAGGKHIMAMPRKHKKLATEFSQEEWCEMAQVHQVVEDFYKDDVYFSCTRENFPKEKTEDSRSVEHWHMHFLPGTLKWKALRNMLEKQGFTIPQ